MKLRHETAELYVPDETPVEAAIARTTSIGIGAHQDDLEILGWPGILDSFQREDRWFGGIVVTNGAGSPRSGPYARFSDRQMIEVRRHEQRKAAFVGEYGFQALLGWPSAAVKDGADDAPTADIVELLGAAQPERVFTHNPADKHDTHVAVCLRVLDACRRLPEGARPRQVLGVEIWRDLDWLSDDEKVVLDCSAHDNLQAALLGIFDSQVCGGKRYDLAAMGRRRAQATFLESHAVDEHDLAMFALDLTPLVARPDLDVGAFIAAHITRFAEDVRERIGRLR